MSDFDEWWENLCISGLLVPSHPDKASAKLAWTHQQARIDALTEAAQNVVWHRGKYCMWKVSDAAVREAIDALAALLEAADERT